MNIRKLKILVLSSASFLSLLFIPGCATPVYDELKPIPEYSKSTRTFDTSAAIQYIPFTDPRINTAIHAEFAKNSYTNIFTTSNYEAKFPKSVHILTPLDFSIKLLSCKEGRYIEMRLIVMVRSPGYVWWNELHSSNARYFQAFSRRFTEFREILEQDYQEEINQVVANLFSIEEFRSAIEPAKQNNDSGTAQNAVSSSKTPWSNLSDAIRKSHQHDIIRWSFIASERGDKRADELLAAYLLSNENICGDNKRLFKVLTRLAENGQQYAQNKLAGLYKNGHGVEVDHKKALYWYSRAAEQGLADAQFKVGWFAEHGIATRKSRSEAIRWYKKAASQNHLDAAQRLKTLRRMPQTNQ